MARRLRVLDEAGGESIIEGVERGDWEGLADPCPVCGARSFRHVEARGGRYEHSGGQTRLRSDYWDAKRVLSTACLNCGTVLSKHPAVDLLFERSPTSDAGAE